MKKAMVLATSLGIALLGLAEPAIKDGSVVGYWKFNEVSDPGKDSSGYLGQSIILPSGMEAVPAATGDNGGFDGSGYLNISTAGATASVELGGGNRIAKATSGGTFNKTTTYAPHTIVARFKADCSLTSAGDAGTKAVIAAINDKTRWHFAAMRYQKGLTPSSSAWMIVTDPEANEFWSDGNRAEVAGDDRPEFPVLVDDTTVRLGGKIGTSRYSASYKGFLDEAMVINRMMTKEEITRLCQTGETYIYVIPDSDDYAYRNLLFAGYYGWSTRVEYTADYAGKIPGAFPGAAYMLDNDMRMMAMESGTFGGDLSKKVSLTIGRTAPLKNMLTGEVIVSKTSGKFAQHPDAQSVAFYDLRLNDGIIEALADGQALSSEHLDVGASESNPFVIAVPQDVTYTLNVTDATTGSGFLAKTGKGTLVVPNYRGTAKLRLVEGSVKTSRLDGYAGGTVLVSKGSVMAFTGSDELPTAQNKLKFAFEGDVPTAKTAVMTLPSGVTAAMVQDLTNYGGQTVLASVENGTLFVTPIAAEDLGAVPVLMVE